MGHLTHAGREFVQFGPDHLGALIVAAAITTALILSLRRARNRGLSSAAAVVACRSLAVVLVLMEVGGLIALARAGAWSLRESLPLHLCDLALFAVVVALFVEPARARHPPRPRAGAAALPSAYELAYFWGLGGTIQALLTPDLRDAFPNVEYFRFFILHAGIVTGVLMLTLGLGVAPRPGSVPRVVVWTNAAALPVMAVNALTGANYMFLCGPPRNPSLYDYLGPWPWTLLVLELVGAVVFTLLYLPFWLARRAAHRSASGSAAPGAAAP